VPGGNRCRSATHYSACRPDSRRSPTHGHQRRRDRTAPLCAIAEPAPQPPPPPAWSCPGSPRHPGTTHLLHQGANRGESLVRGVDMVVTGVALLSPRPGRLRRVPATRTSGPGRARAHLDDLHRTCVSSDSAPALCGARWTLLVAEARGRPVTGMRSRPSPDCLARRVVPPERVVPYKGRQAQPDLEDRLRRPH